AVRTGLVDVGVSLRQSRDRRAAVMILTREGSDVGRDASRLLIERTLLANARDNPAVISAFVEPVPNEARQSSDFVPVLVPLVLILMTMTGAVYPAIDLTAGERERGTLEILVAAPIPRLSVLFAKYVAVLTVALLTAIVNLGMMALTLGFTGLGKQLF